jgi:hypothetical protein
MKQLMEADVLFDNPRDRDLAIVELTKLGFGVEHLDRVDEHKVSLRVRTPSDLDDNGFLREIDFLVQRFSGQVEKIGRWIPASSGLAETT